MRIVTLLAALALSTTAAAQQKCSRKTWHDGASPSRDVNWFTARNDAPE